MLIFFLKRQFNFKKRDNISIYCLMLTINKQCLIFQKWRKKIGENLIPTFQIVFIYLFFVLNKMRTRMSGVNSNELWIFFCLSSYIEVRVHIFLMDFLIKQMVSRYIFQYRSSVKLCWNVQFLPTKKICSHHCRRRRLMMFQRKSFPRTCYLPKNSFHCGIDRVFVFVGNNG